MPKPKRYIVVPRDENIREKGLSTGKGKVKFGKKTAVWVDDPGQASEIDARYGLKGSGEVWVEQDENLEWHAKHDNQTDGRKVGIHHYTFGALAGAARDNYDRIFRKKRTHGKRLSKAVSKTSTTNSA